MRVHVMMFNQKISQFSTLCNKEYYREYFFPIISKNKQSLSSSQKCLRQIIM